eukprot:350118-Hanusia_phi.AAC.3
MVRAVSGTIRFQISGLPIIGRLTSSGGARGPGRASLESRPGARRGPGRRDRPGPGPAGRHTPPS